MRSPNNLWSSTMSTRGWFGPIIHPPFCELRAFFAELARSPSATACSSSTSTSNDRSPAGDGKNLVEDGATDLLAVLARVSKRMLACGDHRYWCSLHFSPQAI